MAPQHENDVDEPEAAIVFWWLKPLYVFGVPAGIAIFLVWFLTSTVSNAQAKVQTTLDALVLQNSIDQSRQLNLLAQICLNTSQTERERAQCQAVTR